MKVLIVTNNPLARDTLGGQYELRYHPVSYKEVLLRVRDLIHQNHQLYSHPLSGSVKPNETPYKSVFLSLEPKKQLDFKSVEMIENSIATCDKFVTKFPELPERMDRDFQLIDLTLLQGALSQIL